MNTLPFAFSAATCRHSLPEGLSTKPSGAVATHSLSVFFQASLSMFPGQLVDSHYGSTPLSSIRQFLHSQCLHPPQSNVLLCCLGYDVRLKLLLQLSHTDETFPLVRTVASYEHLSVDNALTRRPPLAARFFLALGAFQAA